MFSVLNLLVGKDPPSTSDAREDFVSGIGPALWQTPFSLYPRCWFSFQAKDVQLDLKGTALVTTHL